MLGDVRSLGFPFYSSSFSSLTNLMSRLSFRLIRQESPHWFNALLSHWIAGQVYFGEGGA